MSTARAPTRRRPAAHLSWCVALAAVGAVALGAALWVVLVARLGPVVWSLDSDHGMHTGDAVALPLLGIAAWALSRSADRAAQR